MYSKHFKTKFHEEFGDLISSKICNLGDCESKSFSDSSRIIQHLYGKQHGILEKFIADKIEDNSTNYWKNEETDHASSNIQTILDLTKNDEIIDDKININQNNSSSGILAEEFSEFFSKIHQEINQDDVVVVPITIPIMANKNKSNEEIQACFKKCTQCSFYANNRAVLDMHLKNFHQKNCEFCEKSFNELKELENHMLLQHENMHHPLFINKRFVLNEMFQQNASKFAIFYV